MSRASRSWGTPEQFAEFETQELKRWKTVIEQGKITAE
jgi:hypothetical protein